MALGNTRMRCWYAYGGKPYAYGWKRWHFERELVSVGTRNGKLLRVAYAYGMVLRVWVLAEEWAMRVWD